MAEEINRNIVTITQSLEKVALGTDETATAGEQFGARYGAAADGGAVQGPG